MPAMPGREAGEAEGSDEYESGMRACDGKQRFETWALANEIASRSRRRRESNRHAYRCDHCNGFHIGSIVGKKRRRHDEEMPA